jgi:hypothetical protein
MRLQNAALFLMASSLWAQAPEPANRLLPRVAELAIPRYPPLARIAKISGRVDFLVKTDGTKISTILKSSGPKQLIANLEKQLMTWRFEPHEPMEFTVTFDMHVAAESICPPGKPDEIKLVLPSRVEMLVTNTKDCDPIS